MKIEGPGTGHRPDTMYVQSQYMPWTEHAVRGEGCTRRVLSRNIENGAESFVMRLAPKYKMPKPGFLTSDFEFFVIAGEVDLNGITYTDGCYAMHPAGIAHNSASTEHGATILVITLGGPDELNFGPPQLEYRADRLVEIIDTIEQPWFNGVDRRLVGPVSYKSARHIGDRAAPPSTMTKLIWQDPDSNGYTFLKSDLPRLGSEPGIIRTHTIDAEYFVLQGDYIIAGEGRMSPGAYFFWAAGEWRGPSACENISLSLVKYYGPTGLRSSGEKIMPSLNPPHKPNVPPEYLEFARPFKLPNVWV